MTFASWVCMRICTRPASARCRSSVHSTGRSPMTATTRSTMVACALAAQKKARPHATRNEIRARAPTNALPLAVLEPFAGAGLAVLFAFLLTRVARQKAGPFDHGALLG